MQLISFHEWCIQCTSVDVQMHADTFHKRIHAHTETEMHAWMDAHIMSIIILSLPVQSYSCSVRGGIAVLTLCRRHTYVKRGTDRVRSNGGFCRWNQRSVSLYSHLVRLTLRLIKTRCIQQFRTALQGLNLHYYACVVVLTCVLRFVLAGLFG